jgi:hypothetical protein
VSAWNELQFAQNSNNNKTRCQLVELGSISPEAISLYVGKVR